MNGQRTMCGLLVLALLVTSVPARAQELVNRWSHAYGDAEDQYFSSIAVDAAGDVVIAGAFLPELDFGGGPLPADFSGTYLAMFDHNGAHLWSRSFPVVGSPQLAVDTSGAIVLAGVIAGPIDFGGGPLPSNGLCLAKFDAGGNHLWSHTYGSIDRNQVVRCAGLAVSSSGDILITGYFEDAVDFGGGPLTSAGDRDIFVAKYGAGGAPLWSRAFGGPGEDAGRAVAVSGSGNVDITGEFNDTIDFGGGLLIDTTGHANGFVLQLDTDGDHVWSRKIADQGWGMGICSDGDDIYLTGDFTGSVDLGAGVLTSAGGGDIFVAKLTDAGATEWSLGLGDAYDDLGDGVSTDPLGNVVVVGETFPWLDGWDDNPLPRVDLQLIRITPDGSDAWSSQFVGDMRGWDPPGLAVDGSGNVWIAGEFAGWVDFGGSSVQSEGGLLWDRFLDIFLAEFTPAITATLLAQFEATTTAEGVELRWMFGDPSRVTGAAVERALDGAGPWVAIAPELHDESGVTVALDRTAEGSGQYFYRLVAQLTDGSPVVFGPISASRREPLTRSDLALVSPNPTTGGMQVQYAVARAGRVRLELLDISGRVAATLVDRVYEAGRYVATWDGAGRRGRLSPGLYFVRLVAPDRLTVRKLAIVR